MNNDERILKDAQFRKGLSIAYFNSLNAAISLISTDKEYYDEKELKEKITQYRDWFLDEHKRYYSEVIAQIGVNYIAKDTIEKLNGTTNLEELKSVWLSLSEDERRDGSILEVKSELKIKYEKI